MKLKFTSTWDKKIVGSNFADKCTHNPPSLLPSHSFLCSRSHSFTYVLLSLDVIKRVFLQASKTPQLSIGGAAVLQVYYNRQVFRLAPQVSLPNCLYISSYEDPILYESWFYMKITQRVFFLYPAACTDGARHNMNTSVRPSSLISPPCLCVRSHAIEMYDIV